MKGVRTATGDRKPGGMTRRLFSMALAGGVVSALSGCGGGSDGDLVLTVDAQGVSSIDLDTLRAILGTYPCPCTTALSAAEAADLAYMREEEQLAHDVYAVSATLYTRPIFDNIAQSEATHSAAIEVLLDRYEQADPLDGLPNGTFKTPAFQTLYDSLVAASAVSLIEALKVGVQIEELDIYDLTAKMSAVDNQDILMVYGHLIRASRNHLRAFMNVLTQEGGTYVPQYLTQAEFDAIVNAPMETGR